jgi:hypothetical protein
MSKEVHNLSQNSSSIPDLNAEKRFKSSDEKSCFDLGEMMMKPEVVCLVAVKLTSNKRQSTTFLSR